MDGEDGERGQRRYSEGQNGGVTWGKNVKRK